MIYTMLLSSLYFIHIYFHDYPFEHIVFWKMNPTSLIHGKWKQNELCPRLILPTVLLEVTIVSPGQTLQLIVTPMVKAVMYLHREGLLWGWGPRCLGRARVVSTSHLTPHPALVSTVGTFPIVALIVITALHHPRPLGLPPASATVIVSIIIDLKKMRMVT